MERVTRRRVDWVTANFVLSVWVVIGGTALLLGLAASNAVEFWKAVRPFSGHLVAAGISLVAVESLLWYQLYRHEGREARWAAGLMGAFLGIKALIALLYNPWTPPVLGYASLSHLLYAVKGS